MQELYKKIEKHGSLKIYLNTNWLKLFCKVSCFDGIKLRKKAIEFYVKYYTDQGF